MAPVRISDIVSGPAGSFPEALTAVGNLLYLSAFHPDFGREVWVYDPSLSTAILPTFETSLEMTLYPNPVRDRFTLQIDTEQVGQSSLFLYDMQGRVLSRFWEDKALGLGEQSFQLGIPATIGDGLYVLTLVGEHGSLSKPIIVKR